MEGYCNPTLCSERKNKRRTLPAPERENPARSGDPARKGLIG
jgi:hypothetical protein